MVNIPLGQVLGGDYWVSIKFGKFLEKTCVELEKSVIKINSRQGTILTRLATEGDCWGHYEMRKTTHQEQDLEINPMTIGIGLHTWGCYSRIVDPG